MTVNAGNVHDSVAFDGLYERLKKRLAMRYVVADAGYKTPWICKRVIDDGLIPVLPYKRPMGKDGFSDLMSTFTISILIAFSAPKTIF